MATDRLASSALGLLLAACVANDRSDRPPLVPPAPPQSVINTVGFDDAMRDEEERSGRAHALRALELLK